MYSMFGMIHFIQLPVNNIIGELETMEAMSYVQSFRLILYSSSKKLIPNASAVTLDPLM